MHWCYCEHCKYISFEKKKRFIVTWWYKVSQNRWWSCIDVLICNMYPKRQAHKVCLTTLPNAAWFNIITSPNFLQLSFPVERTVCSNLICRGFLDGPIDSCCCYRFDTLHVIIPKYKGTESLCVDIRSLEGCYWKEVVNFSIMKMFISPESEFVTVGF